MHDPLYIQIGFVYLKNGAVLVDTIHASYITSNATLRLDDYFGSILYENGTAEDAAHHPLTKVITPEGYVDYATAGKPYCYYRQDHLGSIREVDSYSGNNRTVVQKTQYYPSGTSFQENYGAGEQPYKFTGKELITMHGLNWQDFGARWLDNVRLQFTSMDPMAEKYYSISPYAYCGGNPVNRIDPDGRWIKGTDGKAVTYSTGSGWSSNATSDAKRIGNSMMYTHKGQSQLNKMFDATHPVTLQMSSKTITGLDNKGNKTYQLGNTNNTYDNNCKVSSSVVTIYEGSINEYIKDNKNSKDPEAQSYQTNAKDNDQRIGAVAGHESVHATDSDNQQQKYDNDNNNASNDVESVPIQTEDLILDQTGFVNSGSAEMVPLPNPLSSPLNAPQPEPLKINP